MIDFQYLVPEQKPEFDRYLHSQGERGCEYSFVNLYLWGKQKAALVHDHLVFFSQFDRRSVYLYPVGFGDKQPVLEALRQDARERGIPCRLVGLTQTDCDQLEALCPGCLETHFDRDSFDYVYDIHDLAQLPGRKFQRKRNHLNRFRQNHPEHTLQPITEENLQEVRTLVSQWYALRLEANPHGDYRLEQAALEKALTHREALGMEGLLLRTEHGPVAMTLGSRLSESTFDIHFEKALDIADGAYAAINNGFAAYLQEKYPTLSYLNREDDMGLEGLRKAKLSYNPHHLLEKRWVCLTEDCCE